MNKITKPITISSPGRSEKLFPPPLMRFLRSNVGSKSRRRSRASPLFLRKKNTLIEATQEPSSPKVTCIGQVRVRRSKKKNKKKTTAANATPLHHRRRRRNRLCRCLRNLKPRTIYWTKLVSFFRCGSNYKSTPGDVHVSPPVVNAAAGDIGQQQEQEKEQEHEDENDDDDAVNEGLKMLRSVSTPKNAFLLTRCRSAPYRSTSLASVFRESTVEIKGLEEEEVENLKIKKEEKINNNEVENGGSKCNEESNGDGELKASPLILTRCKSEPARTRDKILV